MCQNKIQLLVADLINTKMYLSPFYFKLPMYKMIWDEF